MSTITFTHPRETARLEFFRMITELVFVGRASTALKRTRMAERDIARAIKLPEKTVKQSMRLHEMFLTRFGRKPLIDGEANVVLDTSLMAQFLSNQPTIQLVADISGMSATSIQRILNHS